MPFEGCSTDDYCPVHNLHEPQPIHATSLAELGARNKHNSLAVIAHLTCIDIEKMLDSVNDPMGVTEGLIENLKRIAYDLFRSSPQSTCLEEIDLWYADVQLDRLGLLFATLALRKSACSDQHICNAFLELSIAVIDDYTGESTFDLVLALYVQHMCVLRIGTSNRSRAIITHAIRAAHDLGMNKSIEKQDASYSRLYLMICFADQYCAQSSNKAPFIKKCELTEDIFDPLVNSYPHFRPLVRLILLNGEVLEKLYTQSATYENVLELERITGQLSATVCNERFPPFFSASSLELKLERLVQIHLFWSRIIMRVSFLTSKQHWLPSLSICLRAAQMILSIYFEIFLPVVRKMVSTDVHSNATALWDQARNSTQLPASWRQVQRITTSVFIVIYALWKGEATYDEACNAAAKAVLLLDLQRGIRWGPRLGETIHAIHATVKASKLDIRPALHQLFPEATNNYIETLSKPPDHQCHAYTDLSKQLLMQLPIDPQNDLVTNFEAEASAEDTTFVNFLGLPSLDMNLESLDDFIYMSSLP